jgi:hypothetical protein
MESKTKTLNNFILRLIAIILHAILNFVAVNYLTNFDLTGSWLIFIGFILVLFVFFLLFIKHLLSFIYFIKNK